MVTYTPEQMFDLIHKVEEYPHRFEWCVNAEVLNREENAITARLQLRFAGMTQTFSTRNVFVRADKISLQLIEGPLKSLQGEWAFSALGSSGCKVALALDFDYVGGLAGAALRIGFQRLADRMVDDFCAEARRIYG